MVTSFFLNGKIARDNMAKYSVQKNFLNIDHNVKVIN